MSRSRKKFAIIKDNDGPGKKRFWKRLANRRFRRTPIADDDVCVHDARQYKAGVDSWDIYDFAFIYDPQFDDPSKKYRYLMK